ncbi:hypothetical protein D3C81_1808390 [compost metagenome]
MMTNPINSPEKISPSGILEMGIGPNEYKIPTANDSPPINSTKRLVSITRTIPAAIAIASNVKIMASTFPGFIL